MTTHTTAGTQTEPIWFLDTLAMIRVPADAADGRISVVESLARRGDSPPLHVHEREDEAFYVLEGELRLRVQDTDLRLTAGQSTLAPRGIPHTYRVESDTARWLAITSGDDFEQLVRSVGRPADRPELPEPAGPPTPAQVEALAGIAGENHIELVGPPLA
jgi:quercetin dioxygenase-like cupin family protein